MHLCPTLTTNYIQVMDISQTSPVRMKHRTVYTAGQIRINSSQKRPCAAIRFSPRTPPNLSTTCTPQRILGRNLEYWSKVVAWLLLTIARLLPQAADQECLFTVHVNSTTNDNKNQQNQLITVDRWCLLWGEVVKHLLVKSVIGLHIRAIPTLKF